MAQKSSAFQDGVSDRHTWEDWFGDTGGEFRAGAAFWAMHRTEVSAAQCRATGPPRTDQWIEGCEEAQSRSARFDLRLRVDPGYRQGWNSVRTTVVAPDEGSAISPVLPRRRAPQIEIARHEPDEAPPVPVAAPPAVADRSDALWPLLLLLAVLAAIAGWWKLRSK